MEHVTDEVVLRMNAFDAALKGLTGPQIGRGITEYLIPGINYKQSSKVSLRYAWATRESCLAKKKLSDFTLDEIREAAIKYQAKLDDEGDDLWISSSKSKIARKAKPTGNPITILTTVEVDALRLVLQHTEMTSRRREGSKLDRAIKLLSKVVS
ncbi:hypothetical protein H1O16_gp140 [Burkholderia phage BcepSaruman]|uniref:Uncharacterized protein n=1 Tax=Burkholderia phage BcepSaruman TaxID=2530032 RepID=A0A4D5ZC14_9CAUD|nr:hypothetical protein H1O16_gp140 [Burkholderia phage BcepSaruman]QBX06553.1 hypothetical protein BcepSaruman_140 [Burkholderia phage BcepSaruman]